MFNQQKTKIMHEVMILSIRKLSEPFYVEFMYLDEAFKLFYTDESKEIEDSWKAVIAYRPGDEKIVLELHISKQMLMKHLEMTLRYAADSLILRTEELMIKGVNYDYSEIDL